MQGFFSICKSVSVIHHMNKVKRRVPWCCTVRILSFYGHGLDSVPGWGTEILQVVWLLSQKKTKVKMCFIVQLKNKNQMIISIDTEKALDKI